ncbi:MAG: protein phosphatase 2C domain-containing protein [Ktedonobacterales bacterium]
MASRDGLCHGLQHGLRRSGGISGAALVLAMMALLIALLGLSGLAPLAAAAPVQAGHLQAGQLAQQARHLRQAATTPTRPAQSVAYARIAVVRVLTYYYGRVSGSGPIPVLNPCAADGILIGTTGANLNSYNYVLTPSAAVSPVIPCQGVQAAFQQLNGAASGWGITRIQVLLDAAYTGVGAQQMGSVVYTIDPTLIATNGDSIGPSLLALPLQPGQPSHDLPVLTTPQPSDVAPNAADASVLDLVGYSGQLLGRDSLISGEINSTLYPVSLPASQFTSAATPTRPPSGGGGGNGSTGGTAVPTNTSSSSGAGSGGVNATNAQTSIGAPAIDGNGRLIGMVIADTSGNHVLASLSTVQKAIGAVSGKSGPLMTQWQQGLTAFYANPPQYSQASSAFSGLASSYPDFGGVAPFKTAASQQSTTIPSLTATGGPITPTTITGGLNKTLLAVIGGAVALLVIALLVGVLVFAGRRRRTHKGRQTAQVMRGASPDEAMLNLLPPDTALDDLDDQGNLREPQDYFVEQETRPQPAMSAGRGPMSRPVSQPMSPAMAIGQPNRASAPLAPEEIPTAVLSAPNRPPTRPRTGTSLTAAAAGMTNPGIKRAGDPNQDNIFAAQGLRLAAGRPQPYSLFIVADGMGGHLNGQEASRLAIEYIARTVVQPLTTGLPLDDATLTNLLVDGVQRANHELLQRNRFEHGDMGTTVTAALVVDDRAYVVNVGDSRTYVLSPDAGLRQITKDHSVVASLVEAGVIRPEEVYTHPRRNQIYRSLGGEDPTFEVDTFMAPLQAGDKLLLCSDGLWEMVHDPQIASILRGAANPQQAVELLTREANANGGEDNIGVIVVRMLEETSTSQRAEPGLRVIAAPTQSSPPQQSAGQAQAPQQPQPVSQPPQEPQGP